MLLLQNKTIVLRNFSVQSLTQFQSYRLVKLWTYLNLPGSAAKQAQNHLTLQYEHAIIHFLACTHVYTASLNLKRVFETVFKEKLGTDILEDTFT